ncbi:hypothetical protein FA95DRAFT_1577265 [Auriscalpium vulgare]|uniref:Uncharacterized protein n=1 Tax=Auriscalpium vulgare TaxID=40419 RepID=A0ACB8R746_9AGAM|nr:hypothetical protein FA95DRAFT_1577265 [Auriscalpium vulgare]
MSSNIPDINCNITPESCETSIRHDIQRLETRIVFAAAVISTLSANTVTKDMWDKLLNETRQIGRALLKAETYNIQKTKYQEAIIDGYIMRKNKVILLEKLTSKGRSDVTFKGDLGGDMWWNEIASKPTVTPKTDERYSKRRTSHDLTDNFISHNQDVQYRLSHEPNDSKNNSVKDRDCATSSGRILNDIPPEICQIKDNLTEIAMADLKQMEQTIQFVETMTTPSFFKVVKAVQKLKNTVEHLCLTCEQDEDALNTRMNNIKNLEALSAKLSNELQFRQTNVKPVKHQIEQDNISNANKKQNQKFNNDMIASPAWSCFKFFVNTSANLYYMFM